MKRSADSAGSADSADKGPAANGTQQDKAGGPAGADTVRRSSARRWVVAGIGVVAVFVAAGFVGSLVRDHKAKTLSPPTTATGKQNLAVPVWGHASVTLTVYEDMRDPASLAFAQKYDATLAQLVGSGSTNVEYREITGMDAAHGGNGSLEAGNALACAVDTSVADFARYRKVLLENQPTDPSDDAYGSTAELIRLSKKVKALDTDVFRSCVDKGNHKVWVQDSQKDFAAAGYGSAPVLTMTTTVADSSASASAAPTSTATAAPNSTPVALVGSGSMISPEQLTDAVIKAAKAAPMAGSVVVVTGPSDSASASAAASPSASTP
ncbi:DsbA family protein [Streptacidiphilus carbonis]|jgi:hypothetical protein|uniref:DsbA family protein n=1 Tax=Streptacidiphilus carbonis TaxID=105422 RepID=UPI0006937BE4|nr:thioredoxin domain-containing protein [Streptacidiphilus carbonis]